MTETRSEPSPSRAAPWVSDLVMLDAVALSRAIRTRAASCVEVITAYLDHIDRLDPLVNAIVSRQDRAMLVGEAQTRDDEIRRGLYRGPLHGFPQAVKDLAATRDCPTTEGSPLLRDFVPEADSIFVERMRAGGAIVIGKTNTPEFGLGSQTYNRVFGTTLNAYDQSKTAGGSSGGAAVALALRMLPVADGSDHAGSLRNPGAFNNVLGLRPSFGRVPVDPHEVFLPNLGVAGPMARTVSDLGLLLSVQAGPDERVPLSIPEDPAIFAEPLSCDPKGMRLGWLGDFGGHLPFEKGVLDLCGTALRTFENMGCTVEEVLPRYPAEAIWRNWLTLRAWMVGSKLAAFYRDPASRALMKPEAQWEVESGLKVSAFEVQQASAERTAWYQCVRGLFETYDFLLLPTAQVFPFDAGIHWPEEIAGRRMDTYHRWMEVVIPATMSGCPTMNVPAGFNQAGLPMGLQIIGPNRAERDVLRLAHAYEEAAGWVEKVLPPLLRGS